MAAYRHSPAFEHLCVLAERRGLQVRLRVGDVVTFAQRRGAEYRKLSRMELWLADAPAIATPIYRDDLEAAALDLLARVAS